MKLPTTISSNTTVILAMGGLFISSALPAAAQVQSAPESAPVVRTAISSRKIKTRAVGSAGVQPPRVTAQGEVVSAIVRRQDLTTGGSRQVIHLIRPRPALRARITDRLPLSQHNPGDRGLTSPVTSTSTSSSADIDSAVTATPQVQVCNGNMTVTVLATDLTYGASGLAVPLHLDYTLNGIGAATALFGGNDLQGLENATPPANADPVVINQAVNFGANGIDTISFTAHAAFPDFVSPSFTMDIANEDPTNALLLVNGDNLAALMNSKGVQAAFGSQVTLGAVLASLLDVNGDIMLAPNEILGLYELGTINPASPAFDFQDLVVKITLPCAVVADLVVRDTIGINGEFTADPATGVGLAGFTSWQSIGGDLFFAPGSSFISPVSGKLSTLITNNFGNHNEFFNFIPFTPQDFGPNTFTWQVKIWDCYSLSENPSCMRPYSEHGPTGQGGPQGGFVFNIDPNLFPIEGLKEVGTPAIGTNFTFVKYNFTFNLSSLNFQINANQRYIIDATGYGKGSQQSISHSYSSLPEPNPADVFSEQFDLVSCDADLQTCTVPPSELTSTTWATVVTVTPN